MCFLTWKLHSPFLAVQSWKQSTNSWFSLAFWASDEIALSSWMRFVLDHASGIGKGNVRGSCLMSPTEKSFKDQCRLCYLQRLPFLLLLQGQNRLFRLGPAAWTKKMCHWLWCTWHEWKINLSWRISIACYLYLT